MKRLLIFVACVLTLLTSISILAKAPQGSQEPQGQARTRQRGGLNGEKSMKRLDINNDGVISRDEWKGKPEVFDKIDKNGNGSLTREELGANARDRAERLNQMDTNNDGKISRDEWKGPPKRFDRLDANSDEVISKEELRSARQNRQKN
jgi:hypothetical protein